MPSAWRIVGSLAVVIPAACSPDSQPTGPVSFSHTGIPDINGRSFLGKGHKNLCSLFLDGTQLPVFAIPVVEGGFFNVTSSLCPANDFSIPVEPGSYMVRVNLPVDQPRGDLPQRWLEPAPVNVDVADVIKDIQVGNGSALAGRATVDGSSPASGVSLTVGYSDLPGFGAGLGISGPTGAWQDAFLPSGGMILQRGIRYTFIGCQGPPAAGIREVQVSPTDPVLFPDESGRLDCDFITGDALRYTHQATRLKLTSYPGDIGGFSDPVIFPDLGYGYSAQFPLPAGQSPRAGPDALNRQLFRGGLVLGIAPDIILAGTELSGYVSCSVNPCRALGFDGRASVAEVGGGRRDITWNYTDAGSLRPVGLEVAQRSFDGQNGADYVLYAFRITNRGSSPITFTPGVFLDFDVSPAFFNNIGYTELGGQLMITTSPGDVGSHLGHVIVNGPVVPRTSFFTGNDFGSESDLVAALRGEVSNPAVPDPTDVRGVQGGNTVKLVRGKSSELWVAIVAGDDRTQTVANARAAIADATARQRAGNTFAAQTAAGVAIRSLGAQARVAATLPSGRLCKTGCTVD